MTLGRRSFLRILGVGGASAPLAAKAAVEAEIGRLTSLVGHSVPPLNSGIALGGAGAPAPNGQQAGGWVNPQIAMSDYLKLFGKLPDHIEYDVRQRNRLVYHLDADIANKRSWSLSVKILTQS